MSKPMIKIHNTETDEVIEREMTDFEYEQHLKDVATFEAEQAERQVRADKRADLLDRLGITEEEARILLG